MGQSRHWFGRAFALAVGRERALGANRIEGLDFGQAAGQPVDRAAVALPLPPSSLPRERTRWRVELAGQVLQPPITRVRGDAGSADHQSGERGVIESEHGGYAIMARRARRERRTRAVVFLAAVASTFDTSRKSPLSPIGRDVAV